VLSGSEVTLASSDTSSGPSAGRHPARLFDAEALMRTLAPARAISYIKHRSVGRRASGIYFAKLLDHLESPSDQRQDRNFRRRLPREISC